MTYEIEFQSNLNMIFKNKINQQRSTQIIVPPTDRDVSRCWLGWAALCLVMHKKPKRKARLEESEIASRTIQVRFVFVCFSLAIILHVRSFTFQLKKKLKPKEKKINCFSHEFRRTNSEENNCRFYSNEWKVDLKLILFVSSSSSSWQNRIHWKFKVRWSASHRSYPIKLALYLTGLILISPRSKVITSSQLFVNLNILLIRWRHKDLPAWWCKRRGWSIVAQ